MPRTNEPLVTLYYHCGYNGREWKISKVGDYNIDAVRKNMTNDNMSAVKVKKGYAVRLYQHANYRGRSIVRTSDDPCFVNDNFNDVVSSLKVYRV